MGGLPALKQLSVADNVLSCVPECISLLPSLSSLWLYGNSIATLPRGLGCMASLVHLWLEGAIAVLETPACFWVFAVRDVHPLYSSICLKLITHRRSSTEAAARKPSHFPASPACNASPEISLSQLFPRAELLVRSHLFSPSLHFVAPGNPLTADAVDQLLAEVSQAGKLKSVGLDDQQVSAEPLAWLSTAGLVVLDGRVI